MRKRPRSRPVLNLLPSLPPTRYIEQDRLLTLDEAAAITGLSMATWRAWIATRKIPYVKLGRAIRIKQSVLDGLITHGERLAVPEERPRPSRKVARP
jgi:excisionase family DNA binding protein